MTKFILNKEFIDMVKEMSGLKSITIESVWWDDVEKYVAQVKLIHTSCTDDGRSSIIWEAVVDVLSDDTQEIILNRLREQVEKWEGLFPERMKL